MTRWQRTSGAWVAGLGLGLIALAQGALADDQPAAVPMHPVTRASLDA
ncbi:MAG: hypothetical protein RLZZ282_287, partial [Verrucomicrobiota bacterium]